MSQNTLDIWQRRWNAIEHNLDILMSSYEKELSSRRPITLPTLINGLDSFARSQFYFFHDGLITRNQVSLEPIEDDPDSNFSDFNVGYPIDEHVLSTILRQIAEDAAALRRASEQRELSIQPIKGNNTIASLTDIDSLAFNGLQVLQPYLSSKEISTVVTYFQRSVDVRVIPYASVALIGVPLTTSGLHSDIGVFEDLLAIPHELGHYVYWNGSTTHSSGPAQRFYRTIPEALHGSIVQDWGQEIFCDIIGCMVGGPAIARSFLEMQLEEIGTAFTDSDGHHPTPALRPLIYARILKKLDLPKSAKAIKDKWDDILKTRQVYANRTRLFAAYQAVDVIWDILQPDVKELQAHQWSKDGSYKSLYENLDDQLKAIIADVSLRDLEPFGGIEIFAWRDLLARKSANIHLPKNWDEIFKRILKGKASDDKLIFAPDQWLDIFDFDAWITAGPRVRAH